jgi:hypothetical protein
MARGIGVTGEANGFGYHLVQVDGEPAPEAGARSWEVVAVADPLDNCCRTDRVKVRRCVGRDGVNIRRAILAVRDGM